MFEAEGKKQAGNGIYLILPFVKLHERMKYGGYASNTAMDGFSFMYIVSSILRKPFFVFGDIIIVIQCFKPFVKFRIKIIFVAMKEFFYYRKAME